MTQFFPPQEEMSEVLWPRRGDIVRYTAADELRFMAHYAHERFLQRFEMLVIDLVPQMHTPQSPLAPLPGESIPLQTD